MDDKLEILSDALLKHFKPNWLMMRYTGMVWENRRGVCIEVNFRYKLTHGKLQEYILKKRLSCFIFLLGV